MSIDTERGAAVTQAADMTDIELVFCRDRGQTDILVEQLERILRFEIAADRRRAIVARDGRRSRATPVTARRSLEATCLRVARAASLGAEAWAIVGSVGGALYSSPDAHDGRCRPHALAVACWRD